MTNTVPPPPNAPPPGSGPYGSGPPTRPTGAPRNATVPLVENIRITAPDLARRAQLRRARRRLVVSALFFTLLFCALITKLVFATVLTPLQPPPDAEQALLAGVHHNAAPDAGTAAPANPGDTAGAADPDATAGLPGALHPRAMIEDRNGQIMAISLPTAELYADPRQMMDLDESARRLKQALPQLDREEIRARLGSAKHFVYLARHLTPEEQLRVNDLGIPGISFQPSERRHYPLGRVAAQVLGGVDVDERGVAGTERAFDQRLRSDPTPLRLSIDVRIQAVVHDELQTAMQEFTAIGGCGIVFDVRTGEVLAMVSLPDYDANDIGSAAADARFNRAITGMYEPGSTFKLQTAAMALDSGLVHIWDEFDAAHPIKSGRFTITDFEGKHRWLYLPEVLAYSSNLGAARIAATVGADRQRAWLHAMGMFGRLGIELPERGLPIVPPAANWKELTTMTVGFGHGIAVSPLHVVRGTATLANGGYLVRPTILAQAAAPEGAAPAADNPQTQFPQILQAGTSDTIRKLMRLVVTDGYGKPAEVVGYFVGGKTGTAEKVGAHGYKKHTNVSAFISVFPMNAPRYAVYMMLDEPHATAATHGYSTAGYVAAPFAGHVIARIGPMLGLFPETQNAAAIQASLAIPLQPGRPAGARALGPGTPDPGFGAPVADARPDRRHAPDLRHAIMPALSTSPAISEAPTILRRVPGKRHEATTQPASPVDATRLAVN